MVTTKDPEFTDYQLMTLVMTHPGSSIRDLLRLAEHEMPAFNWTVGKIAKSLYRLEAKKKIEFVDGVKTVKIEVPIKIVLVRNGGVSK